MKKRKLSCSIRAQPLKLSLNNLILLNNSVITMLHCDSAEVGKVCYFLPRALLISHRS